MLVFALGLPVVRIPHACGGEPNRSWVYEALVEVFPTRVGVNRLCASGSSARWPYSPRVWG